MEKAKRDSKAVFNPEVYRENCPFERGGDTPWVWCLHCETIYEFGWYVWEEASMTKFNMGSGWDRGECCCPVKGCGAYFLDHWWLNSDGSRADTGDEFIKVPFEAWQVVSPYDKEEFKLSV